MLYVGVADFQSADNLKGAIMLKAETISNILAEIKPRKAITWPVYNGDNILEAKEIEEYVSTFFRTGTILPIPFPVPSNNVNLGLNIYSVEVSYDDEHHTHKIVLEGVIVKMKGETP